MFCSSAYPEAPVAIQAACSPIPLQVCRLCFELYSQYVQLEEAAAAFAEAMGVPPGTMSAELPGKFPVFPL